MNSGFLATLHITKAMLDKKTAMISERKVTDFFVTADDFYQFFNQTMENLSLSYDQIGVCRTSLTFQIIVFNS